MSYKDSKDGRKYLFKRAGKYKQLKSYFDEPQSFIIDYLGYEFAFRYLLPVSQGAFTIKSFLFQLLQLQLPLLIHNSNCGKSPVAEIKTILFDSDLHIIHTRTSKAKADNDLSLGQMLLDNSGVLYISAYSQSGGERLYRRCFCINAPT